MKALEYIVIKFHLIHRPYLTGIRVIQVKNLVYNHIGSKTKRRCHVPTRTPVIIIKINETISFDFVLSMFG